MVVSANISESSRKLVSTNSIEPGVAEVAFRAPSIRLKARAKRLLKRIEDGARTSLFRWQSARHRSRGASYVMLLSADPWSGDGSRGDQAMLTVAVDQIRQRCDNARIYMPTFTSAADGAARRLGVTPLACPDSSRLLAEVADMVDCFDSLIVVGADVMDGHYGGDFAEALWRSADLAARQGLDVRILGFSFNGAPHPKIRSFLTGTDFQFRAYLRDGNSLQRFQTLVPTKGELVADTAFLLTEVGELSDEMEQAIAWVQKQRRDGRRVIGVNVNPHLFLGREESVQSSAEKAVAEALGCFGQSAPCAVLLLPHDVRPESRDDQCLGRIGSYLKEKNIVPAYLVGGDPNAGELKRLVRELDAVVTGRMHLAIASLGQGVPVGVITYQGKFEGLLKHFDLPAGLTIAPDELVEAGPLVRLLESLFRDIESLRTGIRERLPEVTRLALKNFDCLLQREGKPGDE